MKIGLLQCDHVNPEFLSEFGDYTDMFTNLLLKVDSDLEFNTYTVIDGDFPVETDECDAWLVTGSRHGTYEALPWIDQLSELIRQLDKEKRKLAGICFGHQLIAQALGGVSRKSDKGWGVGLQTWEILQLPPGAATKESFFSLLASHQDQVEKLPPGATVIASSNFCQYAAYQVEEHILTFQGHPEFTHDYSAALMKMRADRIPVEQLEAGIASLERPADDLEITGWIVRFLKGEDVPS